MDLIFDVIAQIFNQLLSSFITIPLDNALAVLYVIANAILLLFGTSLEG